MLKKFLTACLAVFILTAVSGINVLARAFEGENEKSAATVKSEKKLEKSQLVNISNSINTSLTNLEKSAYSRAAYDMQKAQGKKFSTTTKVLIGVGIAAAVVGIVVFAASRDKIKTF